MFRKTFTAALTLASLAAPMAMADTMSFMYRPYGDNDQLTARMIQMMGTAMGGQAAVQQHGNGNAAGIAQGGGGNTGVIYQNGDDHSALLQQNGCDSFMIVQYGTGAQANVANGNGCQVGILVQGGY